MEILVCTVSVCVSVLGEGVEMSSWLDGRSGGLYYIRLKIMYRKFHRVKADATTFRITGVR